MIHYFAMVVVGGLGLACLIASILTWSDARAKVSGPLYWAVAYGLYIPMAFLLSSQTLDPALLALRSSLVYSSIALQLIGFARFYQLKQKWPLLPLIGFGVGLAFFSVFALKSHPQLQQLASNSYYVILFLGGSVHLTWIKLRKDRTLPLGSILSALAILTGLGVVHFFQALGWDSFWYWFKGGEGEYYFFLLMSIMLAILVVFQLRLVNRSLVKQIISLDRDMAKSQGEMLVTLAEVIESSSHETAGHVYRVGEYAQILAMFLGKTEAEARLLSEAAHLHDIGKIGISQSIIEKSGPLTDREFHEIKSHTTIGHEILSRSDTTFFRLAARIALEHHENWDGTGYPQGLSGTQISQEGRIVALCDVFDALSHKRIYKDAWSMDRILGYVEEQRGKKFDPELVDFVLAHTDMFIAVARSRMKNGQAQSPITA